MTHQGFLVCAALILVLGAIGALTYGLKYLHLRFPKKIWWRTEHMKIVESLHIDPKNRLVLVQCYERQHLILVGPSSGQVVETNILPEGKGV
jgi:flagellar biogenesis protein FliO